MKITYARPSFETLSEPELERMNAEWLEKFLQQEREVQVQEEDNHRVQFLRELCQAVYDNRFKLAEKGFVILERNSGFEYFNRNSFNAKAVAKTLGYFIGSAQVNSTRPIVIAVPSFFEDPSVFHEGWTPFSRTERVRSRT